MAGADAAMTLPASMYRDPDVYERERRAVFAREWLVFARAEQLRKPGSQLVRDSLARSES